MITNTRFRNNRGVQNLIVQLKKEAQTQKEFDGMDENHKLREMRRIKALFLDTINFQKDEIRRISVRLRKDQNQYRLITKLLDKKDFEGFKKYGSRPQNIYHAKN